MKPLGFLPKPQLFHVGSRLPRPIKRGVKAAYYYARWWRHEKDIIVLSSIQKSGTNYFRRMMANYLMILYQGREEPVTYDEFHNEIFPNIRNAYLEEGKVYRSPHPVMRHTPYTDFVYGHKTTFLEYCRGPVVFLYRNPLDNIVSMYFFRWKNRAHRQDMFEHPRDVIDRILPDFAARYAFFRDLQPRKASVFRLPYEVLMRAPFEAMTLALNHLALKVDVAALRKAVAVSGFDAVRAEEDAQGKAMHAPAGYKGYFTRSGRIGEWKDYFDENDVARIAEILASYGIGLDEFIVE